MSLGKSIDPRIVAAVNGGKDDAKPAGSPRPA